MAGGLDQILGPANGVVSRPAQMKTSLRLIATIGFAMGAVLVLQSDDHCEPVGETMIAPATAIGWVSPRTAD